MEISMIVYFYHFFFVYYLQSYQS